ncbi:MAG: hypothetical protein QOE92_2624 [Chloroflexota bacterium]|nr:hypothetical protein [Chloroflexota bacterium]
MHLLVTLLDLPRRVPGGHGPGGPSVPGGASSHWVLPIMGLFFLLAMVAVVVLIVMAVTRRPRGVQGGVVAASAGNPVISELELRYARGEISREDFLQRRADLTGSPPPLPPAAPANPSPPAEPQG